MRFPEWFGLLKSGTWSSGDLSCESKWVLILTQYTHRNKGWKKKKKRGQTGKEREWTVDKTSLEYEYWSDFHLFLNLVQFLDRTAPSLEFRWGFYGWNGSCSDFWSLQSLCYKTEKEKKKCTLVTYWSLSSSPYVQPIPTHSHTHSESGGSSSTMNYIYYTWKLMNVFRSIKSDAQVFFSPLSNNTVILRKWGNQTWNQIVNYVQESKKNSAFLKKWNKF